MARLLRREAKQKGFSGVPERGGGPNGDSRVSFQGRKLLHLLPSVLNHSQPWEKSSWSQPSFSIPKLPRGLPRTQVASFLGLAGRRPLPPRMLPPQETPPDSASFTPILPPSGPGWGSGLRRPLPHSLGVRRMRGWAGRGGVTPSARSLFVRGVGTEDRVSPGRAPAHAALCGLPPQAAGSPLSVSRGTPAAWQRSLSLPADQSPFGVQDSRRSTYTALSPSCLSYFLPSSFNFHSG